VLKGDPIHSLNDAVKRKRYHYRNAREPTHPPQCSRSDIKSEGQNEQSKEEDSHKDELREMDSYPTTTAGILRKNGGVVIGIFPTGVKGSHEREKHFPDDHQRRCQTKQAAIDHDDPPVCIPSLSSQVITQPGSFSATP
jgi:hypothetical protein